MSSRILGHIDLQLGRSLQWVQSWVQDESSLRNLLEDAVGLRVQPVFKQDLPGAGVRNCAFQQAVGSPMFRNFGDASIRDEVKRLFVEKFEGKLGPLGSCLMRRGCI